MSLRNQRLLYGLTIGSSSVLLFSVQPVMAKAILPRFGGTTGVWITSMLFFQVVLLMGYLYSYLVTRHFNRKLQASLHMALLILSLAGLPLSLRTAGTAADTGKPVLAILGILLSSVGLPYFLLSTTSPLLQAWLAASSAVVFPYRLFALSNAASLAALLAYPVVIEPLLPLRQQMRWWSVGYAALVLCACLAAVRHGSGARVEEKGGGVGQERRPLLWIGLACCASTLWLAVANHLSREVAAIPFLWVLCLSLYLLSFILCFEGDGWYRPALFRWLLPAAWLAAGYRIARGGEAGVLKWELPLFCAALLIWCVFCHGELARTKPRPRQGLAFFYLMIALGGALGAVFVGVVAPNIFSTYLELPIGITASILLGLFLLYGWTAPRRLARLGAVAIVAFLVATKFRAGGDVVHLRNFYGALQVTDSGEGDLAVRSLYNGRTLHGLEFLSPARSRLATSYFGPESGAGRVLERITKPGRRVGIVGLGAGTLAAYGRRGDSFRFYEIDPAVIQIASRYFRFLAESDAKPDIVAADGRLALEKEPLRSLDVIILDAFSDDSIPVHLLTREAFAMYFDRLRDGGPLAIHVTNRYVELAPVIEALGANLQKVVVQIHNPADPERQILAADWAVVFAPNQALRDLQDSGQPRARARNLRLWTDDYSNLFQVLK